MSLEKVSPVEARKTLSITHALVNAGIDCVPVVVESAEHRKELLCTCGSRISRASERAVKCISPAATTTGT